jgi:hypothetical protein
MATAFFDPTYVMPTLNELSTTYEVYVRFMTILQDFNKSCSYQDNKIVLIDTLTNVKYKNETVLGQTLTKTFFFKTWVKVTNQTINQTTDQQLTLSKCLEFFSAHIARMQLITSTCSNLITDDNSDPLGNIKNACYMIGNEISNLILPEDPDKINDILHETTVSNVKNEYNIIIENITILSTLYVEPNSTIIKIKDVTQELLQSMMTFWHNMAMLERYHIKYIIYFLDSRRLNPMFSIKVPPVTIAKDVQTNVSYSNDSSGSNSTNEAKKAKTLMGEFNKLTRDRVNINQWNKDMTELIKKIIKYLNIYKHNNPSSSKCVGGDDEYAQSIFDQAQHSNGSKYDMTSLISTEEDIYRIMCYLEHSFRTRVFPYAYKDKKQIGGLEIAVGVVIVIAVVTVIVLWRRQIIKNKKRAALAASQQWQQPRAAYQQPGAAYQQPGAVYQQPGAVYQQPGAVYQQPGTAYQQPGAVYQQPGTAYQQYDYQPGTAYQQYDYQPGAANQQPTNQPYDQPGAYQ